MDKIGHVLMQIELARGNKLAACSYLPEDTTIDVPVKDVAAWLKVAADQSLSKLVAPFLDQLLVKTAFIPSPAAQQGGGDATGSQPPGGDPSQGQPSGGGQPQAGSDPAAAQEAAAAQQQQQAAAQQPAQGADGRGAQQPTDLDKTTVTLSLRDVIDLTSNGKATQSALKIQDAINKQQMKAEQMQRQQAMKEQQQQQQNQMGAQQGGGMMDSGGIYGGQPQQDPSQQQGGQPSMM